MEEILPCYIKEKLSPEHRGIIMLIDDELAEVTSVKMLDERVDNSFNLGKPLPELVVINNACWNELIETHGEPKHGTNEIKQKATELMNDHKKFIEQLGNNDKLYSENLITIRESLTRKAMVDFFRSFDKEMLISDAGVDEFYNEKGLTSEYIHLAF